MKKRNYTIDILKGFAILLIVYVHMHFAGARFLPKITEYLQTFNLPLFSFASGFLTCGRTDLPFGKYFIKKGRALFVPYMAFFFIGFVIIEVISQVMSGYFIRPDIQWLWGFLVSGNELQQLVRIPNGVIISVLWFFPTTFFAYVLFWFVSKFKGKSFIAATIVLAIISLLFQKIYAASNWTTPFNIKVIPLFTFYMCFGAIFKTYLIGKITKEKKVFLVLALLALAAAIFVVTGGMGNIRHMKSWLFLPVSVIQITAWYGFFSAMKRFRLLEYFGRHSLYIYGIHVIFLKLFALTGINITDNYLRQAVVFIVDIALCCICFEAYERIKFKLVGK